MDIPPNDGEIGAPRPENTAEAPETMGIPNNYGPVVKNSAVPARNGCLLQLAHCPKSLINMGFFAIAKIFQQTLDTSA